MKKSDDKMEIICLENILRYEMNPTEAKAYKISCVYIDMLKKLYPLEKRYSYGTGDPRKRFLFKCCYKLLHDVQHNLDDADYHLYVRSQIDIIRSNSTNPNFTPNCLVGEKAWKRWLVWKRLFEKKGLQAPVSNSNFENDFIFKTLLADKKKLSEYLKGLSREKVEKAVINRSLLRWIATKQISPFYALLCPILKKYCDKMGLSIKELFYIDFSMYAQGINQEVIEFFNKEFEC